MSYSIEFLPEAEETYDYLVVQLKDRWGANFVLKLQRKLIKTLELISQSPSLYPVFEQNSEVRRCILHKNCSMLYKVQGSKVIVVCFWDNRQDPIIT